MKDSFASPCSFAKIASAVHFSDGTAFIWTHNQKIPWSPHHYLLLPSWLWRQLPPPLFQRWVVSSFNRRLLPRLQLLFKLVTLITTYNCLAQDSLSFPTSLKNHNRHLLSRKSFTALAFQPEKRNPQDSPTTIPTIKLARTKLLHKDCLLPLLDYPNLIRTR